MIDWDKLFRLIPRIRKSSTLKKTLRIGGVPEHFNLPWKLALADDAFVKVGVNVEYSDYPGGTGDMTRALRENALDAALVLTEGALADVVTNNTNRLVKVYVDSPLTWGIHVASSSDIKTVDQTESKRIAISRYGSGSHLIAILDVATRGWRTGDLSFVVVNNLDGARRALATGDADVFLWERHTTQPLVDSGEFRRVAEREVPWPAFVVSVRRDVLDSSRNELKTVLKVVARCAANLKRRKNAAALIADTYGIQIGDVKRWLCSVRWSGSFRRPASALQRAAKALEAQGVIREDRFRLDELWETLS